MSTTAYSRRLFIIALGVGLFFSTHLWSAQRQRAREAIAAANKEFEAAFNSGDAKTIANQYTKEAQTFKTRLAAIKGREAITEDWRKSIAESKGFKAKVQTTEVQEAGDWAYETGRYVVTVKDGNVDYDGKYVLIWKFEEGKWKIHREIGNENPPNREAIRAAIDKCEKKYLAAYNKCDAAALAALYTEDAQSAPPEQDTVRGRPAIAQYWKKSLSPDGPKQDARTLEVDPYGDFALELGTYVLRDRDGNIVEEGKYSELWKRDQGEWRIWREIWAIKPSTK